MTNRNSLKIDSGFKNLICPLVEQEYQQLKKNLLHDGCRDPILIWNGFIIDGHNRYEICSRNNIPFTTKEMNFSCRDEAIAWICANQLGRRNITIETRKFLIGMQYEAEKKANIIKNKNGTNQYSKPTSTDSVNGASQSPNSSGITNQRTAQIIADDNHISHGTVEKYAVYSRALNKIDKAEPKLASKILSGHCKISHDAVVKLSSLPPTEIRGINQKLECNDMNFVKYMTTRKVISRSNNKPAIPDNGPSIKDMPVYDPDAEITGLILTIPSWISSIDRVINVSNPAEISVTVRKKTLTALFSLQNSINEMINYFTEEHHE